MVERSTISKLFLKTGYIPKSPKKHRGTVSISINPISKDKGRNLKVRYDPYKRFSKGSNRKLRYDPFKRKESDTMPKIRGVRNVNRTPTELKYTAPMQDILELGIFSGRVKGEKPVSLMLMGKPESGRTEMLKKITKLDGIAWFSDTTAYGILDECYEDFVDNKLHHLVFLDFIDLMARKWSTVKVLLKFLNSLIEDGYIKVSTYATRSTKQWKQRSDDGAELTHVECGMLAACTTVEYVRHLKGLRDMGFESRVVPFSIGYSTRQINEILESIALGKYKGQFVEDISLDLPKRKKKVKIKADHCRELIDISDYIKSQLSKKRLHGFRLLKRLRALAKASALRDGRRLVSWNDIDRIRFLSNWMNYQEYPLTDRWYKKKGMYW